LNILGLHVGLTSVGWALISADSRKTPLDLVRSGVRVFEAGVEGSTSEFAEGRERSKSAVRRASRLQRRQTQRRVARRRELFLLLQQAGLLPSMEGGGSDSVQRRLLIQTLDRSIALRYQDSREQPIVSQLPLLFLRKRAISIKMELHELGRIFYHLSQRRGFVLRDTSGALARGKLSGGKLREPIDALWRAMRETGARTIGEFLAQQDPHLRNGRWRRTDRRMYQEEFAAIWEVQHPHHPQILTAQLRRDIETLLFYQHPPNSRRQRVGRCDLEPDQRRTPLASLAAQRFQIFQQLDRIRIVQDDSVALRPLSSQQRVKLYQVLDTHAEVTLQDARILLDMPAHTGFNFEGMPLSLKGNSTQAVMLAVFGDRWRSFSSEEQGNIVETWRRSTSIEKLIRWAMVRYELSESSAQRLANAPAPSGYSILSKKALRQLLPLMLAGKTFESARDEIYKRGFGSWPSHDLLPPVRGRCTHFNEDGRRCEVSHIVWSSSPALERSLTEMRKTVNSILREYGKPTEIHVEIARELKMTRQARARSSREAARRRKQRNEIYLRIRRDIGIDQPSRTDIEKVRLHDESRGICPYTGRSISFEDLFHNQEIGIEYIIPLSRYPDDSFQNKTLCYLPEVRLKKRNHIPWEAFGKDARRWNEILERVRAWKNNGKLRRFLVQSSAELARFVSRQFTDTRYISAMTSRYLSSLYGGDSESDGSCPLSIFRGSITAALRRQWGLQQILPEILGTTRKELCPNSLTDHRYHAVDAITCALTTSDMLFQMAASSSLRPLRSRTSKLQPIAVPWTSPVFILSVRAQLEGMLVSHRPMHKLAGALHGGTNYPRPYNVNGKSTIHKRYWIKDLKVRDIGIDTMSGNIVDWAVAQAVRSKLQELGGDPELFGIPGNEPVLKAKNGKSVLIRKVRVRETWSPLRIGQGLRERYVDSGGIHHIELFAILDERGNESWVARFVQITEAYERHRQRLPIISRKLHEREDYRFLFSLAKNDSLELDMSDGARVIFRVKKFYASGQIWFTDVNNAQADADQLKRKTTWSKTPAALKALNPRKVIIDLLGKSHPAND
jgi:CRISPR-associated endonuclease Csn1